MRVVVTGGTGQVGSEVVRCLDGRAEILSPGRAGLDLSEPDGIRSYLAANDPDLIVNAAAYTAVDRAESEPDAAVAVNARALAVIGEEARRRGAAVVHYSTDYVFDGTATTPYEEDDPTAPRSVYGRTKRIGEVLLAEAGAAHLTLRIGWVYSHLPGNFLTTMLSLMAERVSISVVADEIGAPTWSRDVARATVGALEALAGPPATWTRGGLREALASRGGLFHLAPTGCTSWHGFAEEIRDRVVEADLLRLTVRDIVPIPASEWPAEAARPPYSLLSAERIARETGVRLPGWRDGVMACLAEVASRRVVGLAATG